MKILVCMKQVPQKDAPLKLNECPHLDSRRRLLRSQRAGRFRSGRSASPERKTQRRGGSHHRRPGPLAAGFAGSISQRAPTARFIWKITAFVGLDAFNTANAFAAAIKDEQFDLIFTGLQSDDYGYAQTGVILAELLGWPHATIIMQIEKNDGGIRVKRELEAGYFQFVDMPLPAVLTIQSGINKLRYATLIGIKQAKNKPLRKVALAEVQSAIGANFAENREALHPAENQENRIH